MTLDRRPRSWKAEGDTRNTKADATAGRSDGMGGIERGYKLVPSTTTAPVTDVSTTSAVEPPAPNPRQKVYREGVR